MILAAHHCIWLLDELLVYSGRITSSASQHHPFCRERYRIGFFTDGCKTEPALAIPPVRRDLAGHEPTWLT